MCAGQRYKLRTTGQLVPHLKPPVVRPHVVAHSSQKADVPHRRPVDVVEGSILKGLKLLEFVLAHPALCVMCEMSKVGDTQVTD